MIFVVFYPTLDASICSCEAGLLLLVVLVVPCSNLTSWKCPERHAICSLNSVIDSKCWLLNVSLQPRPSSAPPCRHIVLAYLHHNSPWLQSAIELFIAEQSERNVLQLCREILIRIVIIPALLPQMCIVSWYLCLFLRPV